MPNLEWVLSGRQWTGVVISGVVNLVVKATFRPGLKPIEPSGGWVQNSQLSLSIATAKASAACFCQPGSKCA